MPPLAHIDSELKKSTFCGLLTSALSLPEPQQFQTFTDFLKALIQPQNKSSPSIATAEDYKEAELMALSQIQDKSFPEKMSYLKSGKPLPSNSQLLCLAPELHNSTNLILVGGYLWQISQLEDAIHPIILDTHHPLTKLIIKNDDDCLPHQRVFAEIRRKYWVLRGWTAVRNHQLQCTECQKWQAKQHPPQNGRPPICQVENSPASFLFNWDRLLQSLSHKGGMQKCEKMEDHFEMYDFPCSVYWSWLHCLARGNPLKFQR